MHSQLLSKVAKPTPGYTTTAPKDPITDLPNPGELLKRLGHKGIAFLRKQKKITPPTEQKVGADARTVGNFAAGGLAVGLGAGSIIELIRAIRSASRDQKARRVPGATDENTIVLTLPPKTAEVIDDFALFEAGKLEVISKQAAPYAPPGGAWTLAYSGLGAAGGVAGGMTLMAYLASKYREAELKRQVDAARKAYISALSGEPVEGDEETKAAFADLENLFELPGQQEKTAEGKYDPFGPSGWILGLPLLMSLVGAGGTAYFTKRILDERRREEDAENEKNMVTPPVSRIILKSASGRDLSIDEFKAAVNLAAQGYRGDVGYLDQHDIKMAAAEYGLSPDAILKKAQEDIGNLVDDIASKYPKLWSSLVTNAAAGNGGVSGFMANNFPLAFRTAVNLPGFNWLSRKVVGKGLQSLADTPRKSPVATAIRSGAKAIDNDGAPLSSKLAALNVASLLAGATGAKVLDEGPSSEEIAKDLANELERREPKIEKWHKEEGKVSVQPDDEDAQVYIAKNPEKIKKLIQQLAASGRL